MHFSSNIKYLRGARGLTQSELASSLNVGRTAITNYEKGVSKPAFDELVKLSELFDVNLNDLIFLDLSNKVETRPEKLIEPFPVLVDTEGNERIAFVDVKASAGYPQFYSKSNYLKKLPSFQLPGTEFRNGTFRCFEVSGQSMEPTLFNNDWCISRFVELGYDSIKNNNVYVVVTDDQVYVKRLLCVNSDTIRCYSDNPEYPYFDVKLTELRQLWYIVKRITSNLSPVAVIHSDVLDTISLRLLKVENKLQEIEQKKSK